jgi:hypothetical protein
MTLLILKSARLASYRFSELNLSSGLSAAIGSFADFGHYGCKAYNPADADDGPQETLAIITRLQVPISLFVMGAGIGLCSGCQEGQPTVQKAYYPNGKLHVWQEVRNNQLHGRYRQYAPTGQLQATCVYVQGKLTGEMRVYYENGALKSRSLMLEDSLNGPTWLFYRNGVPKQRSMYRQGRYTGIMFLFDSLTGKKVEHQVYNSVGTSVYVREYDKEGKPTDGILCPITEAPDTVSWGSSTRATCALATP